jgi:hypothetical protein
MRNENYDFLPVPLDTLPSSWPYDQDAVATFARPLLAAWGGLCTNFTLFTPIFGGDNDMHHYDFLGRKHVQACLNVPLYNLVSIFKLLPAGIKMRLIVFVSSSCVPWLRWMPILSPASVRVEAGSRYRHSCSSVGRATTSTTKLRDAGRDTWIDLC